MKNSSKVKNFNVFHHMKYLYIIKDMNLLLADLYEISFNLKDSLFFYEEIIERYATKLFQLTGIIKNRTTQEYEVKEEGVNDLLKNAETIILEIIEKQNNIIYLLKNFRNDYQHNPHYIDITSAGATNGYPYVSYKYKGNQRGIIYIRNLIDVNICINKIANILGKCIENNIRESNHEAFQAINVSYLYNGITFNKMNEILSNSKRKSKIYSEELNKIRKLCLNE